jgi:hypothetical protein
MIVQFIEVASNAFFWIIAASQPPIRFSMTITIDAFGFVERKTSNP